jgi:diphosphomevalonate decarboxylase
MDFYFEGKENQAFKSKIEKYLNENKEYFTFLNGLHLNIESHNSFPHSSGIASSASSMSALILCLLAIKYKDEEINLQEASFLSRLASGSAARSVYPKMTLWGKTPSLPESSDEYAIPIDNIIHPVFKSYHDSILIVSSKEKSVSSRAGHSLMNNHPMAETRYATARKNTEDLLTILKQGDLEGFIKIAESEANQLHDLMATSTPSYTLKEPNTINIIDKILEFRKETCLPICYTLDAGPNVHLLYPDSCSNQVHIFIDEVLKNYCFNNKWIDDNNG